MFNKYCISRSQNFLFKTETEKVDEELVPRKRQNPGSYFKSDQVSILIPKKGFYKSDLLLRVSAYGFPLAPHTFLSYKSNMHSVPVNRLCVS